MTCPVCGANVTAQVTIRNADFLQPSRETFDFVIGNPPYVSILELSAEERLAYRTAYRTACAINVGSPRVR